MASGDTLDITYQFDEEELNFLCVCLFSFHFFNVLET